MAEPVYNPSGTTAGTLLRFFTGLVVFTAVMVTLAVLTSDLTARVAGAVAGVLGAVLAVTTLIAIVKLRRAAD